MPVITIFSGCFCREDEVIDHLLRLGNYRLITDQDLTRQAAAVSGLAEAKIRRAFSARTSVFNKFTHEKETSIAYLRRAAARFLSEDRLVVAGFGAHLIPRRVDHVLRVCLIGEVRYRQAVAGECHGTGEKEALKLLRKHDEDCAAWVEMLTGKPYPWDASLYDMVLPMNRLTVEEAARLIHENAEKDVVQPSEASRKAVKDFQLACEVEVALAREGHQVEVTAEDGRVTLTINKHVLMLSRLEEELRQIAEKVPGVRSVETRVGKGFHRSDIYRRHDFTAPSKVLLVDDEREFVQTLSERLMMRDMGSAVAYDGESALHIIEEDEPEVLLLDLKMPGIDGLEILRRVKQTRPEMEVIILTGHGSEADREACMKLGAFAYLQKPLDIDELSDTIRRANEKIAQKKAARPDDAAPAKGSG